MRPLLRPHTKRSTMHNTLKTAGINDIVSGFRLIKKEFVKSKNADLFTLRHEKSGAQLLYFDRKDENKTFCISFKTLPEDDTGVFHILEHSVLNGSKKYPVKEPFVSLLQSSMQTFLNALTYSDKTVYPISSRNEQDFFNLMSVYLDAVFCPSIYEKPEIFMQEGWHYEFDGETGEPYYNGVVFSEMKGAYADVDRLIEDEADRMLFPDSCYGHSSGGHPEHIPELSYEKFIAAHKRFYHPSNSRIFLDGAMDIDAVLSYIDSEYLSGYDYRAPDFDFVTQTPTQGEKTICYEAQEGEEELAHMSASKIFCRFDDTEKLYAARILADYLAGSNEAPLKRACLERGLAQDISLGIGDGIFQPVVSLIFRNTSKDNFAAIKQFLPEAANELLAQGLDHAALSACLERDAFQSREITEPYGVELAIKALDAWLYGGDPLTHIDNEKVYDALRAKLDSGYFEDLVREMLSDPEDKTYLYVLPSLTKGEDDARREAERVAEEASAWTDEQRHDIAAATERMQQWQQSMDSEEDLATLPHLELKDIDEHIEPVKTEHGSLLGAQTMHVLSDTNGIVYLNMYFDVSDFTADELCMLNVLTACFGELSTEKTPADVLQSRVKATLGALNAKLELTSHPGDIESCKPYLLVSASMLEENAPAAAELISELLTCGRYDETGRIFETILQTDYYMKQSLIGDGHQYAIAKALSAFSAEAALKELLEGESFVRWFSAFAEGFEANAEANGERLAALAAKAFARNRLFIGYSGRMSREALETIIGSMPENELAAPLTVQMPCREDSSISVPGGVGFSAQGHNLYALGGEYSGAWAVMSSLVSFAYLWNEVRVRGGAYGTGMGVRDNGDVFCYSYRDPNTENSRAAYCGIADFFDEFLDSGMPLDDIIIGTVNTTDPLLDPAGVCDRACRRYLRGVTDADIQCTRSEILKTTPETLGELSALVRGYISDGKFCRVG